MKNSILQNLYKTHPGIKQIIHSLKEKNNIYIKGLLGSSESLVCCCIFKEIENFNFLCILNNIEDATNFYYDCSQILSNENVLFFPSRFKQNINYDKKHIANEIFRTKVLFQLNNTKKQYIIVTYPDALAEKVIAPNKLKNTTLVINTNKKINSISIFNTLDSNHFTRVNYVYEPGQYAVRGSIIDIFSFSNKYPYRIDFLGDEVESIRNFNVETQLSKEKLDSISIILNKSEPTDTTLFSYLPSTTNLVLKNEKWIYERTHFLFSKKSLQTEIDKISSKQIFLTSEKTIRLSMSIYKKIHLGGIHDKKKYITINFLTKLQLFYHKNFDLVSSHLKEKLQKGYTLYILSDNIKQIKRIKSIFNDRMDDIPFIPIYQNLHSGFIDESLRISLLTDHQLFNRFNNLYNLETEKIYSGNVALSIKKLQQFQLGDYLVHIDYGIGKFGGLIQTKINGKIQEVIKMIFLNNDIILVSIHSLHKISKYKWNDSEFPQLNKLGSKSWKHLKEKTKKKIKNIAKDLIHLYSKRKNEKGFAFSPDTYLQKELEASFFFEDTPDQMKVTMEIKKDMESTKPMDRLVCGDVGFGKTEIAIRVATKAVADSKQVAILVPTTILALQHYNTFKERLSNFPITVDYISRTKTIKECKSIINKLQEGIIDIIIGTHKMLNKSIKFKNLGLLIIDEEQKFGVIDKEKLKQMKVNIDSLSLTATPIPRTLQSSLIGVKDLSNISTPPPNRYPICTELHCFDLNIICKAINYEINRNGQIFIINNCISDLIYLKNLIKKKFQMEELLLYTDK